MKKAKIFHGVVHDIPADLAEALRADAATLTTWQGLTPLARNEWICWIEDAKRAPTRHQRIARLQSDLQAGKRRPCCWPGCPHRVRNGG